MTRDDRRAPRRGSPSPAALALALAVALAACSSALHEPSPIARYAPGRANGRDAAALVRDADAAFARRGEPGQAAAAQDLYLDAAVADPAATAGLVGAMRTIAFRIERDPSAAKGALATEEVELGQWCQRRAPAQIECDYRLALGLGQLAREHTTQAKDAVDRMVALLAKVAAAAPALDDAGADRVLALVLLRAPAWPAGPGDPDTALEHAKAAVARAPDAAANQLVLGEALVATGATGEAHAAYARAAALAKASPLPEAAGWSTDAAAGLARTGP